MSFWSWIFPARITTTIELPGSGMFAVHVVGESNYQRPLSRIVGGKTPDGVRVEVKATLVHEDDNPHDSKAIRIDVGRHTVGYLDRKNARIYRKRLEAAGHAGEAAKCDAVIVGGWNRGVHDEGHFGIRLDLPIG